MYFFIKNGVLTNKIYGILIPYYHWVLDQKKFCLFSIFMLKTGPNKSLFKMI